MQIWEDKKRYVEECYPKSEVSRKQVFATLRLLTDDELTLGKDFTLFELDELQQAFDRINTVSYSGCKTVIIRFKRYVNWREQNGLPCTRNVYKLQVNPKIAIRSSMVPSPSALKKILDYVFDDPVQGTIDVIYRVFLWMAFSGLRDVEAVKVKRSDINFAKMRILFGDNEYPIYDESRYDFRIACDLMEFIEPKRSRKRIAGDEIMRGKDNRRASSAEDSLRSTIRPMLVRKFEAANARNLESNDGMDSGLELTYNGVLNSGVYYRLYELERLGQIPDFSEYAIAEFERNAESDTPYKVSPTNPRAAIILRLKKSAESDYNNWKKAFDLE